MNTHTDEHTQMNTHTDEHTHTDKHTHIHTHTHTQREREREREREMIPQSLFSAVYMHVLLTNSFDLIIYGGSHPLRKQLLS